MRTLHADLTTAQTATTATPYISITFSKGRGGATTYTYTTADAANRIKAIRHSEEPYNTSCIIVLDNHDKTLPDLFGYYCEISYGYLTSSGNKTSTAPPLWVKHQFHTSKMGSLDNVLYLEGVWNLLAEMSDIGSLLGATSPPYYEVDYTGQAYTIYDIVDQVLEAAGFGLHPLGGEDDSIVDTLQPDFVVNSVPFDNATSVIYRLLNMTKVFCRAEAPASGAAVSSSSDVDVSCNDVGTWPPYGRTGFSALGRYWAFYSDNTNIVFRTSLDGSSWSGKTTVGAGTHGHCFNLWYDRINNHVHYVRRVYGGEDSKPVYYRRGTPNSDGTITWAAAEQVVFTDSSTGNPYGEVNVCVDSSGYAFVTYRKFSDTKPYCAKNANNDGTWSTDSEQNLNSATSALWQIQPIPLPDGKVCVMYCYDTWADDIRCKTWSGSAWGSEETVTATSTGVMGSAVVKGDDVYLPYMDTGNDIEVVVRDGTSGNWGTPTEIVADVPSTAYPQLSIDLDETLIFLVYGTPAGEGGKIYYYKYMADSWDTSATELVDDGAAHLQVAYIRTFYYMENNKLCVVWTKGPSAAFIIKFHHETTPYGNMVSFRILYPSGYSSYDYTYVSDKPATTDHQFREFEWQDQPMVPNHVYVIANQSADGTWGSVITGEYQLAISTNNEYPDIVMYHVAATLTSQGDADNRAAAIALRKWMEKQLGRLVVPHNCGQELYDWIKIRDERGAAAYTDYPPSRWGNEAVVGSLVHVYDPANGVYDLEITINGIVSSEPVDKTVSAPEAVEEQLEEILVPQIIPGQYRPPTEAGAEPFRPVYPQPIISQAARISPWNAMMNMLTGAAAFREDVMGQAVTYLSELGYGPAPGGVGFSWRQQREAREEWRRENLERVERLRRIREQLGLAVEDRPSPLATFLTL